MGTGRILKTALNLIYPENLYCICCGDMISKSRKSGLCDKCTEAMDWMPENPFKDQMRGFAFDELLSCCVYGAYPRQIIYSFKADGKPYMGKNIACLMADRLSLYAGKHPVSGSLICAVPMHKDKERKRGFNQAELLAKEISQKTGTKYFKGLLVKADETGEMKKLSGDERRIMLERSFSVNDKFLDIISEKDIILVDDVVTTGSTVNAAARALKAAGAKRVTVLCFAVSA